MIRMKITKKSTIFLMNLIIISTFMVNLSHNTKSLILDKDEMGWHLDRINMAGAWEITTGMPDIIVAIIDSGIDFSHPELSDAQWINKDEKPDNEKDDDKNGYVDDRFGWDFLDNDNIPGPSESEFIHGHGTFVAGILAAKMDGKGVVGVAPDVKIMDLKILNTYLGGSSADLADAIRYAVDNDAEVINFNLELFENTTELQEAIKYAYEHNVIMVGDTGGFGYRNRRIPATEEITSPAVFEEVIVVSSTDYYDEFPDYCNWGEGVELTAPSVDFDDDLQFWINSTWTPSGYSQLPGLANVPQVAGIVALMKSLNKSITLEQVRDILHTTAYDIGIPGRDIYFGYGMLNATAAILEAEKIAEPRRIDYELSFVLLTFVVGSLLIRLTTKKKEKRAVSQF